MSAIDPLAPGSALFQYRVGERIGANVFQAEDTKSGRKVAIKVLTKTLPRDPARRDAMVKDVQQHAALYHPSIATIIEIVPANEMLLMVMELVEGQPIAKRFSGKPADKSTFFRVAYQAADALKLLHAKNFIHGNLNGDSFVITPANQVKLVGLNLTNILQKAGGPAATYQQKGSDVRSVAYMAPEQIANQPLVPVSDVWSLGVVLYEVATGRLPYLGTTGPEVARKIIDEQPQSPKAVHPSIDNGVLSVMGRCLFKDPFKRFKEVRLLTEEIGKIDPEAPKFAAEIAKAAAAAPAAAATSAAPAAAAVTRNAILFIAEVANYDEKMQLDPAGAQKDAARMQQLLGEAVYLFDGEVLDPFGPRMVAELKSVDSALEAARKGEFDFSPDQQEGEPIPVTMLLHAGEVETRDGAVIGPAVTKAFDILGQIAPLNLLITEEFLKRGRGNVRLKDVGAKAGLKLYEIVPTEPKVVQKEPTTQELAEESAARAAEALAAATAAKKKKTRTAAVAAVAVVVIAAAAGVALRPKKSVEAAPVVNVSKEPPAATAASPRKVFVQPIAVEGNDPSLADRAKAIRLASMEVLRGYPEVRVSDAASSDATPIAATMRASAMGPELAFGGAAAAAPDAASGIQSLVQFVATQLKLQPRTGTTPDAYNAFADAVLAESSNDNAKSEASLRAAMKADPSFLPAQALAVRVFTAQGKDADALAAAKQVAALDPNNIDAARLVARASLRAGDIGSALGGYNSVLRQNGSDVEAINIIGRYALAVNDLQKFAGAIAKARGADPNAITIHEPDVLLAAGRIDPAADKYYDVELKAPANPALALKLGRISVLRHGSSIAEAELQKLEKEDPKYGLHMLRAYLFASGGNKNEAANELKAALAGSTPGDDYYTCAAEIAAINGDPKGTLDALDLAVKRKEPTGSYILANPLFSFLQSDARFGKLRETVNAQQNEIRSALANVSL